MKSFHELAAEVAMEKLKSNLAKEAKKAPCRSEDIAEEHGCSCNDGGECKCDADADCCDCNATNEATIPDGQTAFTKRPKITSDDKDKLSKIRAMMDKERANKKEDVSELTIADVQKATAMAKKRQGKEREAGKKSVSTADLAARMPKKESFEPHMMYDPKTGKAYKAEKEADHLRMKKMGYTHDKPETNEDVKVKSADKKPELVNVDGKLVTRMVPTTKRQADKKDDVKEGKKPGLWANMHARRKAGKPKLKPGDKNYPKTLDIESKEESANLKLINRIKNSGVVKTGSMSKDAPVKKTNEGVKTFAEISKGMAGRYIKKAQVSTADAAKSTERGYADSRSPDRDIAKAGSNQAKRGIKTFINRNKGTATAVDKLTGKAKVPAKEETVDEISNAKMGQYVRKAADDAARKGSKGDVAGARQRVKGVSKAMDKMDKNRLYGKQ